jgi:hypothetical protein
MKPQSIMKLAYFTRRFSRYENPFAYRLSRKLIKLLYPREGHTVVTYDQGWSSLKPSDRTPNQISVHVIRGRSLNEKLASGLLSFQQPFPNVSHAFIAPECV